MLIIPTNRECEHDYGAFTGVLEGPLSTCIARIREAPRDQGYSESRMRQLTTLATRSNRLRQRNAPGSASLDDCELQLLFYTLNVETARRSSAAASFTFLLEHLHPAGAAPALGAFGRGPVFPQ